MQGEGQGQITALLTRIRQDDDAAAADLLPLVYQELRALAGSYFQAQRANHTLQPTALVHEAFVRLVGNEDLEYESRGHFFAIAAKAMRHVLADHARQRRAQKRGGGEPRARVTLSGIDSNADESDVDVAHIDEALDALAVLNERQARVVELRFFAGLTIEQIAELLGVGRRTIDADWQFARAWLRDQLLSEE